jgi:hypothetical protein
LELLLTLIYSSGHQGRHGHEFLGEPLPNIAWRKF